MTYYEDVRVPVTNIVGVENGGWALITTQLNHERIGLSAFSSYGIRVHEKVVEWTRQTTTADGGRVADLAWVRSHLAESHAMLEALKLLNWRMAWQLENGELLPAPASAVKVYGTESLTHVYRMLLEIVGIAGAVRDDSPSAVLLGELESEYRAATINTYGGGVNEVQREIVAMLGLGMPRAGR
jgi:alkylation response protein AidB-like acyl-CoA dehydrogenase